jgi:hypothetical protein
MNASLSVRLYHKQKKSPGCVSNKRPVIWHLQDVRVWEEKENVKGNKCKRQKKLKTRSQTAANCGARRIPNIKLKR